MDTLDRKALDLRAVAIHEAGHVVVADALGLKAEAFVEENPDGGESFKHFLGHTRIWDFPSPLQRGILGVAGVAAEALIIHDVEDVECYVTESLSDDLGVWSATDLEMIPEDLSALLNSISAAVALLELSRDDLLTYANELMTPFN